MSHLTDRLAYIGGTVITSGVIAQAAVIPTDHATTIAVVVSSVGVVAAGIAWLDRRQDTRIKLHEATEFAKQEAAEKLNAERHAGIMREIQHVRDLIDIREHLRKLHADAVKEVD